MDSLANFISNLIESILVYSNLIIFFFIIGLVLLVLRFFRDRVIRFLSRKRSVDAIVFSESEVVVSVEPLRRTPLFGALLFVPQGTSGVVAIPRENKLEYYHAGEQVIYFGSLYAFVKYVDIRRRTSKFSVNGALTRDGFQVSIEGRISWRVKEVIEITKIKDPVQEILNEVERTVRSVTSEYNHDQLVPRADSQLIGDSELVGRIAPILNSTKLFGVIDFLTIILEKRVGDPNRISIPPEPSEPQLKANLVKEELENRLAMAGLERNVALHEAQLERDKVLSESDIRLQQATTTSEEDKILRSVKENEVDLEYKREKPRLELEREKLLAQARTEALTPVTQIFAQLLASNGSHGKIEASDFRRLSKVLEFIVGSLWDDPYILTATISDDSPSSRNAKEELVFQLIELTNCEDFIGHRLQENESGYWMVHFTLCDIGFELTYNVSGTKPDLIEMKLTTHAGDIRTISSLAPFRGLTISYIVRKVCKMKANGR